MDIIGKINDFESRRHAVNTNPDLSAQGRNKANQTLQQEIAQARGQIVRDLKIDWDAWKVKARRNLEAVRQEEAEAAKQWDYSRLNYMAQAVKATISNAADFREVQRAYNAAKQSGDNHARRVWAEVAAETVSKKYPHELEAGVFVKSLARDLEEVTSTPKLNDLKAEGTALTHEAAQLHKATERARGFYHPGGSGIPFGASDEFSNLVEGVTITQRLDPSNLATITEVQID